MSIFLAIKYVYKQTIMQTDHMALQHQLSQIHVNGIMASSSIQLLAIVIVTSLSAVKLKG